MQKMLWSICGIIFIANLLMAVCWAENYETKTVFVPDASKQDIYDIAKESKKRQFNTGGNKDTIESLASDYASDVANSYIYDINEKTKQGWEIKSTRRAWVDIYKSGNQNYFWGTEYVLQKPIKQPTNQTKGWPMGFFLIAILLVLIPSAIIGWRIYSSNHEAIEKKQVQVVNEGMKKCPFCAEMIKREAIVCRYCGKELMTSPSQQTQIKETYSSKPELSDKWECPLCLQLNPKNNPFECQHCGHNTI